MNSILGQTGEADGKKDDAGGTCRRSTGRVIPEAILDTIRTAWLLLGLFLRLVRWESSNVVTHKVGLDHLLRRTRVFDPLIRPDGGIDVPGLWEPKKGYRKGTDKIENSHNFGRFTTEAITNQWNTNGAPGGTRTHDPQIKSLLLYQLSYRGKCA